jgi:hypothetical protein
MFQYIKYSHIHTPTHTHKHTHIHRHIHGVSFTVPTVKNVTPIRYIPMDVLLKKAIDFTNI